MQEMDEGQAIEYIEKGFYHADSVTAMH